MARPCVYLDADTALSGGALLALHRELAGTGPRMASPLPLPLLPVDRLARGYAEVWMRLPSVAGQVVGLGCYAVNRAGVERWSAMPRIVADDAFVRSRFAEGERRLIAGEQMVNAFPSVSRSSRGAEALERRKPRTGAPPSRRRSARLAPGGAALARGPTVGLAAPAGLRGGLGGRSAGGSNEALGQGAPPGAERAPLAATQLVRTVVAGTSSNRLDRCLRSLEPIRATADVEVVVVDDPAIAGGSVAGDPAELVLLIEADVVPGPGAIELLLLVARRFPWAGIYGGREARLPERKRSPGSEVIRRVNALRGGLLVVGGRAWKALGEWTDAPEPIRAGSSAPAPCGQASARFRFRLPPSRERESRATDAACACAARPAGGAGSRRAKPPFRGSTPLVDAARLDAARLDRVVFARWSRLPGASEEASSRPRREGSQGIALPASQAGGREPNGILSMKIRPTKTSQTRIASSATGKIRNIDAPSAIARVPAKRVTRPTRYAWSGM